MQTFSRHVTFFLFLALSPIVLAEDSADFSILDYELDPLIVTATRVPTRHQEIGRSYSFLSQEDLALSGHFLPDLGGLTGLEIQQSGGKGGVTSIRIRGLRSQDTKLIIDGMPLRDPSSAKGDAAGLIGDLNLEDIERVEIVRGGSALAGADAVGGVISVRSTQARRARLALGVEGGSFSTVKESFSFATGKSPIEMGGGISRLDTKGIDGNDDYANTSFHVSSATALSPRRNVEIHLRGYSVRGALNKDPFLENGQLQGAPDDPNDYHTGSLVMYGGTLRDETFSRLHQSLNVSVLHSNKNFYNVIDPDGGGYESQFGLFGKLYHGDYHVDISWPAHRVFGGYEFEREGLEQRDVVGKKDEFWQATHALFLQDQIKPAPSIPITISPGIRVAFPERFSALVGGGLSGSYPIEGLRTKLRSHISAGHRPPSLYELFGMHTAQAAPQVIGNEGLDPERSLSWDAGVDQALFEQTLLKLTFFDQWIWGDIRKPGKNYENGPGFRSFGLETECAQEISQTLSGRIFYTWTHAREREGEPVAGVAAHQGGGELSWRGWKRLLSLARLTYHGEQRQPLSMMIGEGYQVVDFEREPYFKLDVALSYRINSKSEFFLRGSNLLDQEIMDFGIRGEPASVMVGVRASL